MSGKLYVFRREIQFEALWLTNYPTASTAAPGN
jgi:hypothetical protein